MMINKWMTRLLGSSGRKVDQVQILYLSIAYLQLFVLAKVIAPQKKWKLFTSRKLCQSGHSPHFSSSVASSCEEFSGFVGGKKNTKFHEGGLVGYVVCAKSGTFWTYGLETVWGLKL